MNKQKNKGISLLIKKIKIKKENRYSLHERPHGIFGRSTVPSESAS